VRRGGGLAVGGRHARTVGVVLDRVVQGLGHCLGRGSRSRAWAC
jgi:hypothetical protein